MSLCVVSIRKTLKLIREMMCLYDEIHFYEDLLIEEIADMAFNWGFGIDTPPEKQIERFATFIGSGQDELFKEDFESLRWTLSARMFDEVSPWIQTWFLTNGVTLEKVSWFTDSIYLSKKVVKADMKKIICMRSAAVAQFNEYLDSYLGQQDVAHNVLDCSMTNPKVSIVNDVIKADLVNGGVLLNEHEVFYDVNGATKLPLLKTISNDIRRSVKPKRTNRIDLFEDANVLSFTNDTLLIEVEYFSTRGS